jgi:molybdenum ABC transporter, periplasmic molybdate-binding protein
LLKFIDGERIAVSLLNFKVMKHVYAVLLWMLFCNVAQAQDLRIFAASSLTDAFEALATTFEAQHQGVTLHFSFEGSSTLAMQLEQGAPADVFASADAQQMARVVAAGLAAAPQDFVHNRLVVIVPEDSTLRSLQDLSQAGVKLVLAAPEVPAGNYAREVLTKLNRRFGEAYAERVLANVVSEEPNVRQVALKVELGEADAAFVYTSDVVVSQHIRAIAIPDPYNVDAVYSLVTLASSSQKPLAEAFVAFIRSDEGRKILRSYGFQATR